MKEQKSSMTLLIKLAKPAQRALSNAGITTLKELSKLREDEVSQLHGIGKNTIEQIKNALLDNGLSFAASKK